MGSLMQLVGPLTFSAVFFIGFGLLFKFIQVQGRKKHENTNKN
ncbi:hypothetical protein [Bacillus solimangrovi]|nr:hypothetical protein [Bacillus solimangrovi]